MTDIRLVLGATGADLAFDNGQLIVSGGLQSLVTILLFTDRRADDDDIIPDGTTNRRGWFADPAMGSKLWLLSREKNLPSVINRARQYVHDALLVLTDKGIASHIEVAVEGDDDRLAIATRIHRPEGDVAVFKYQYLWQAQSLLTGA